MQKYFILGLLLSFYNYLFIHSIFLTPAVNKLCSWRFMLTNSAFQQFQNVCKQLWNGQVHWNQAFLQTALVLANWHFERKNMLHRRNSSSLCPNYCIKAFITLKGQFVFLEKATSYFLPLSSSNLKGNKQSSFGSRSAILCFCKHFVHLKHHRKMPLSSLKFLQLSWWTWSCGNAEAPRPSHLALTGLQRLSAIRLGSSSVKSMAVLQSMAVFCSVEPCQSFQCAKIPKLTLSLWVCSEEIELSCAPSGFPKPEFRPGWKLCCSAKVL